jgi:hypothetical protein
MLADEHILIFILLSANIQPTEFYQLLLLSSSSVFQSAAAPGWTLKNASTAASSGRCRQCAKLKKFREIFYRYPYDVEILRVI